MATTDLKTIMDEIISFKNKHLSFKKSGSGSYLDRSSIAKATKDIIASFPVLCSDTISPPTASMVAKATERNCVVMLQLLFSSAYLKGESGREVLSKWHTNMDSDMNMDDLLDIMDTFGEEAKTLSDTEAATILREMKPVISEYINSMNVVYPESSFSENSIGDYIVREDAMGYTAVVKVVTEAKKKQKHKIPKYKKYDNSSPVSFDQDTAQSYIDSILSPLGGAMPGIPKTVDREKLEIQIMNYLSNQYYNDIGAHTNAQKAEADMILKQAQIDNMEDHLKADKEKTKETKRHNEEIEKAQKIRDRNERMHRIAQLHAERRREIRQKFEADRQDQLNRDKFEFDKSKFDYQKDRDTEMDKRYDYERIQGDLRSDLEFFQKQLLSTDVKKYNELVPSLMVIRFQAVDPEDPRNFHRPDSQCIIGVKTRLVPCDSFDIINHVRSIEKNKISLVNLIRATTKEIHFCKDFVAAIDQAKIDAKQNSRLSKSSPIWRSLQNRSMGSVLSRLKRNRANDAGAITTLVMSIEEVNVLKKDYDIDLTNPAKAKYLMEQYNLLSFVIVDEQLEVARFLYDGEKYFQDYAFATLERETGDNSYKKVINLISKINRG